VRLEFLGHVRPSTASGADRAGFMAVHVGSLRAGAASAYGSAMLSLRADTVAACAERLRTPGYDRARLSTGVVHFGVGGFHRAHQAMYHDAS
jgi:hypothetical protein